MRLNLCHFVCSLNLRVSPRPLPSCKRPMKRLSERRKRATQRLIEKPRRWMRRLQSVPIALMVRPNFWNHAITLTDTKGSIDEASQPAPAQKEPDSEGEGSGKPKLRRTRSSRRYNAKSEPANRAQGQSVDGAQDSEISVAGSREGHPIQGSPSVSREVE
jgi:hypothetical protein